MPKPTLRALWTAKLSGQPLPGGSALANSQPLSSSLRKAAFRGRVLGVDPSLRASGLACLDFKDNPHGRYVASETVRPPKDAGLPECLGCIARRVRYFLEIYRPDVMAIEETIYVQNFRTAQKLGAARGAAIGQAAASGLPVFEYPPLRVKQSVVGYGRASKEQVAGQIRSLLGMEQLLALDEADAAAVAYCHALTLGRV